MKIVSVTSTFILVFLLTALAGTAMVFWSVATTRHFTTRMDLARQSYEQHLLLSTHTYQLFKQYGDALLIGDQDRGRGEAELIALIADDIAIIHQIIEDEIALVGEEEREELDTLAQIDQTIRRLSTEFKARPNDLTLTPIWSRLSEILDNEIDEDFKALMDSALQEELDEVEEAEEALKRRMLQVKMIAVGFALVAVFAAGTAALVYRARVHKRLMHLVAGVRSFKQGDLSPRIATAGSDEIADVARLLNEMSANLQASQKALMDQNAQLEDAVASRTIELQRLLEDAKAAEVHRRHLLADVSHELRTPLTIIQGESDVALRSAKTPEDLREALTRARNAANHTSLLVEDLMTIARKEAGELRFRLEPADLCLFIREVVDLFPKPVAVVLMLATAPAKFDKLRLRQAILALLNNAVVHGGEGRKVTLSVREGQYCIAVSDNGPGMSDHDKAHVFERFYRGSNAGDYSTGTGLGVPIVKAIAEAHGGHAEVSDNPGGGIVFSIFLPMEAPFA